MNDDFKISLVGELDTTTTINNISGKYSEIKGKLPNIELIGQLDIANTINTINGQLSGMTQHLQPLNINANIAGINLSSSQVQQQANVIGNQINNGISQGVNSANNILNQFVNTLHSYRWNDNEIQNAVSEINRLAQQTGITIASLSQSISEVTGKKGTKRVLDVSVEGINQLGQATKLVRQWDLDSGNLVKTTDNLKSGVVATASEMQKLSDQITKVASSYENKVAKIRANVQIGQKPITPAMSADWSQIESRISAINNAIGQFRNSTSATFAQNEAGIKSSITNLEILIKDLQNARYQASVLRANPVEVLRQEAIEKVTQFRNELERAKGDVSQVNNDSIRWLATLNNVGGFRVSGAEIVDILDNIKVARERLNTSNKKEGIDNSLEKVKIQAQSLLTEIEKLEKSKIIPNGFKIDVNGVEKGLENIKNEISLISKTGKGDLSVLSAQFSLFKKELSKMGGSTTANTNFTNSINQWVTEAKGSIKNFDAVFTQTIEHIKTEAASADKITLNNLKSQFSDLKNVYSFLQKMEDGTVGATFTQKSEQLKKFGSDGVKTFAKLEESYNSLRKSIETNDFNEIQGAIKQYDIEITKATNDIKIFAAQNNQNKKYLQISENIDSQKYYADVQMLKKQISEFRDESGNAEKAIKELEAAYQKLVGAQSSKTALLSAITDYDKAVDKAKNSLKLLRTEGGKVNEFANKRLANSISEWMAKNTKAGSKFGDELRRIQQETEGANQLKLNQLKAQFDSVKASARELGLLGKGAIESIKELATKFGSWLSVTSGMMEFVNLCRSAVNELKEIDTLITEISKADDTLTTTDLRNIANNSFDIASKYGKKASDLLLGVQEASRAGYSDAMGIAELSVAAQGAGDMTADLANQYVIATDKSWKFGGSVEELTKVLDGSNYITNHNALNMTDLAEAMSIAGTTAASFGIDADEATAAMGTMIAVTQQSGSEIARAFRSILLNIRQVSDEEEGIDAEGLTKYENACNALNVSLKETKDGVLQLRNPMEVLKELSEEYVKLDESDLRRTELLNSVGGKLRATQLDALLRNWDLYSKMIQEYADGTGSMAAEAEKTANSWEGSLNRLSNTWTDTVQNLADSDAIIGTINTLNNLLNIVNQLTEKADIFGSIGILSGLVMSKNGLGERKSFVLNCAHPLKIA